MLDPEKIRTPRNKYYPARNQIVLEQYCFQLPFCMPFCRIAVCILWQSMYCGNVCGGNVNRRTPRMVHQPVRRGIQGQLGLVTLKLEGDGTPIK